MDSFESTCAYLEELQRIYNIQLYLNQKVRYSNSLNPEKYNKVGILIGSEKSNLVILNQKENTIDNVYPWLLQDVIT